MNPQNVIKKGIGASPGISLGYVHLLDRGKITINRRKIARKDVEAELKRFDEARDRARVQLQAIRKKVNEEQGEEHVYLVEAQLLMLDDRSMVDDTREVIQAECINAEWAIQKAIDHFKKLFDNIDDEYFRDRRSDIEYVEERLLRALTGEKEKNYFSLQRKTIVIAHDLAPSDIVRMNRENLSGFVTDSGGRTSHTAIIARSLGIPIVVGAEDISIHVQNGDRIIVDGLEGTVVLNPDRKVWDEYEAKQKHFVSTQRELLKNRNYKAETKNVGTKHCRLWGISLYL